MCCERGLCVRGEGLCVVRGVVCCERGLCGGRECCV